MTPDLHVHVDGRGLSRPLIDNWLPDLHVDAVWVIGTPADLPDEHDLDRCPVPVIVLSPHDLVAAALEPCDEPRGVLVVFSDLSAIAEAATLGFLPRRVVLTHVPPRDGSDRIAAGVELTEGDHEIVADLGGREVEFVVQSLPNVTARSLTPRPPDESRETP